MNSSINLIPHKAIQKLLIISAITFSVGCASIAGYMAGNEYRMKASSEYVHNLPAGKLFKEVKAYMTNDGMLNDEFNIQRKELRIATKGWKMENRGANSATKSRAIAVITRIDEEHSQLTIKKLSKTNFGDGWGKTTTSSQWPMELEMIRRLDPNAHSKIEAEAEKQAQAAANS